MEKGVKGKESLQLSLQQLKYHKRALVDEEKTFCERIHFMDWLFGYDSNDEWWKSCAIQFNKTSRGYKEILVKQTEAWS